MVLAKSGYHTISNGKPTMTTKLLRTVFLVSLLGLLGACSEEPAANSESAGHGHSHD